MVLLSASEEITSIATLLQVILAIATFALYVAMFGLQASIFKLQQKITDTQIQQAEIDAKTYRLVALQHTNRIMPKFTAITTRCTHQALIAGGPIAIFELDLRFTNNLNIAKNIKFRAEPEEGDIWSELGQSFEKPIIHPGQHFDFHAKFRGRLAIINHYSSTLHFVLEFSDDDLKPYIQHIYSSFGIDNQVHIRNDEPVLLKYV